MQASKPEPRPTLGYGLPGSQVQIYWMEAEHGPKSTGSKPLLAALAGVQLAAVHQAHSGLPRGRLNLCVFSPRPTECP